VAVGSCRFAKDLRNRVREREFYGRNVSGGLSVEWDSAHLCTGWLDPGANGWTLAQSGVAHAGARVQHAVYHWVVFLVVIPPSIVIATRGRPLVIVCSSVHKLSDDWSQNMQAAALQAHR